MTTRSPSPAPGQAKLRPPERGSCAGSVPGQDGVPPAHHAERHLDRGFARRAHEHRHGVLAVGANPVQPQPFAAGRQDLRLRALRDGERDGSAGGRHAQRAAGFPAGGRRHRPPHDGFAFRTDLAAEEADRPRRVVGGQPGEQPCVGGRARGQRDHREFFAARSGNFDLLAAPVFAVPVKDAALDAFSAFVDRHDERSGVATAFFQRGDHRRLVGSEQLLAALQARFAGRGFGFGQRPSDFLERAAGVARQQRLTHCPCSLGRAEQRPAPVVGHLPRERARIRIDAGFRMGEREAFERGALGTLKRRPERPPCVGRVAHDRRRARRDAEPPCLVRRLDGRCAEHRDQAGGHRVVGLRRHFAGGRRGRGPGRAGARRGQHDGPDDDGQRQK